MLALQLTLTFHYASAMLGACALWKGKSGWVGLWTSYFPLFLPIEAQVQLDLTCKEFFYCTTSSSLVHITVSVMLEVFVKHLLLFILYFRFQSVIFSTITLSALRRGGLL